MEFVPPVRHPPSPLQVTATDADSGSLGTIAYSLGGGSSGSSTSAASVFSLGEETGQLCTTRGLDRDEGLTTYDFTIVAIDGVRGLQQHGLLLRESLCLPQRV